MIDNMFENRCFMTSFLFKACDKITFVWDMGAGNYVQYFEGHESDINSIKYHPSGDVIRTGSDNSFC